MEKIIDMHSHLGDICYPNGGALIEKKGIKKKRMLDLSSVSEWTNHRLAEMDDGEGDVEGWLSLKGAEGEMERNFAGTRENFKKSMVKAGVTHSVVLPIPPCVTFEDLKKSAQKDPSIIPFSGIDFTREYDVQATLDQDVRDGARGIKLHPILQCEKLTSKRTFEAVEAFAMHDLPVLVHTGVSHYYVNEGDRKNLQCPEYGEIRYFLELVMAFPKVKFVAGHAGLSQWLEIREMAAVHKNVYIDCTFKGVKTVQELIDAFGPERVLFGSDWPWGNRKPALRIMKKACKGDKYLEKRIFYENAAELLRVRA
jgi:predicted TIM-barrel fold metal-dependent hydrolase